MSFPLHRQSRLDPVLAALSKIVGVRSVQQDDFDSAGIRVHIDLKRAKGYDGPNYERTPWLFDQKLAATKRRIAGVLNGLDIGFYYTQSPVRLYESNGSVFGKRLRSAKGYDCGTISIDVYI